VPSASWHRLLYPGLLLFGLSLPLSKSASNVLLVALYLSAAAGALYSKEFRDDVLRSCRQPLTAAFALLCLVAFVGIVHTEKFADGFGVASKFLSLPAIYFFVSVLLQSDGNEGARTRKAESLLFSLLIGLTALDLVGAATFLGLAGGESFTVPLTPLGMHHIWFSNLNALGLYTAASLLLFARPGAAAGRRLFLGFFLLLSAACILLSTSRTAWFSVALTAAIMAAMLIRSKKTIVLVVLLSVLAATAVYRFVPLVHDRIELAAKDVALYTEDKKAESSVGGRILMWRAALRMYTWHPFVGVGTGDFQRTMKVFRRSRLVPAYLLAFNQPHNMYLFAMATNGTAGLAALLYIFYRSLRSAVPIVRTDGAGRLFAFLALATAVHFMVAGFMDSFFNIQVLRYSFAFIMGVCVRSSASRSRQTAPP
jgi:O-antigen ligase